ncbi:chemotaxis protein CheW [Ideonella livida]|uniref:Chemotaxis protein CheW n=1 Tax=Ideonella livida TaxID=2707176 RepID=A0A7C9PHW1_9BURK|nr:chemotaxis protein CheW [Ideonella livida]NDY91454.1 chemotaxis protein CheW [Ideonella livida]
MSLHASSAPHAPPHGALAPLPGNADTGAAGLRQFLRFALGEVSYAVPIDLVREILEVPPTTAMPMMPSFVRGVMNLRGAVVPVIDLAARLGLPNTPLARRTAVVVVEVPQPPGDEGGNRADAQVLGVLVDAVHEVLETPEALIEPPPALGTRIAPRFIAGITRARGQFVTIVDLGQSLDSEELARMIAVELQD